ncbi:MAG TPA: GAF domain-containing SpoIIE family protein phosphatase [Acidimicrobiales bacterium]|nr:GAF domain-containing SpoIIE family protein phosphatase [Acidimicrobiales bacterium]
MTELEMSPLRRLTTSLSSAVSSDEVAAAILQHGLIELGALTVSLWLIDPESAALEYAGGAGAVPSEVERFASIPLGADLPGTVVASTREPIVYRSAAERNVRWPALASVPGATEASVVLPLEARNDIIGCLTVGFADERDIDSEELAQLLTAADQCALALDRAHLLDRERRARETLEFLAEATRLMVSALDPIDVLDQLLSHAVPLMADWCCVFVHDEEGVLRRTALKVADQPELGERVLTESVDVRIASDVPVARAWRTGRPEHIAEPSAPLIDELFGAAADDVRRLGWRDVVVCPIIARGNRVGVITFAFTTSNRRYTSEVLMAATGLAARAGVALDVAQRYARERTTAATLVAAMLPERLPVVDGWSMVARYLPSGDAVCGDWYDVMPLPDGQLLIGVGDAAGHGLPAAALMAELRNAARGLAFAGHQPTRLLADLSALAAQHSLDSFATAAYGRLDPATGIGSWAVAGHLPPLLVPADGPPRYVDGRSSPPLGVRGPASDHRIDLGPGDTLVLYTDGLVERRHESLDQGLARLQSVVAGQVPDASELADRVVASLCQELSDDCCLLIVRRDDANRTGRPRSRVSTSEPS